MVLHLMNNTAATLIAITTGTAIIAYGLFLYTDNTLNGAKQVTSQTNTHQLATVLELYYLDHNTYPNVEGGDALIETLYKEGYIKTKPTNPSIFQYEIKNQGDYLLSVK